MPPRHKDAKVTTDLSATLYGGLRRLTPFYKRPQKAQNTQRDLLGFGVLRRGRSRYKPFSGAQDRPFDKLRAGRGAKRRKSENQYIR